MKDFMERVNPSAQPSFAKHPEKAIVGDYPLLADLDTTYGREASSTWLLAHVADMTMFTGAKNLDERQQEQLADVLAVECQGLKVTELMLFFYRFKTGRYGRFYGAVDPMVVTTALQDFLRERRELIEQHQDEVAQEWEQTVRREWPRFEADAIRAIGGTDGDLWLYAVQPYSHKAEAALRSADVRQRLLAAIEAVTALARQHFGQDVTLTAHETWFEVGRRHSENWVICRPDGNDSE